MPGIWRSYDTGNVSDSAKGLAALSPQRDISTDYKVQLPPSLFLLQSYHYPDTSLQQPIAQGTMSSKKPIMLEYRLIGTYTRKEYDAIIM